MSSDLPALDLPALDLPALLLLLEKQQMTPLQRLSKRAVIRRDHRSELTRTRATAVTILTALIGES